MKSRSRNAEVYNDSTNGEVFDGDVGSLVPGFLQLQ